MWLKQKLKLQISINNNTCLTTRKQSIINKVWSLGTVTLQFISWLHNVSGRFVEGHSVLINSNIEVEIINDPHKLYLLVIMTIHS